MTFYDQGQNTKAKSFYNTFPGHNASTCQTSCETDNLCRPFKIADGTCKLSASDLTPSNVTIEKCHEDCMYDVTCFGYEYDDLRQECSLSNVRIHGEGLACKSCHFYEKACQSGRHFIILIHRY